MPASPWRSATSFDQSRTQPPSESQGASREVAKTTWRRGECIGRPVAHAITFTKKRSPLWWGATRFQRIGLAVRLHAPTDRATTQVERDVRSRTWRAADSSARAHLVGDSWRPGRAGLRADPWREAGARSARARGTRPEQSALAVHGQSSCRRRYVTLGGSPSRHGCSSLPASRSKGDSDVSVSSYGGFRHTEAPCFPQTGCDTLLDRGRTQGHMGRPPSARAGLHGAHRRTELRRGL